MIGSTCPSCGASTGCSGRHVCPERFPFMPAFQPPYPGFSTKDQPLVCHCGRAMSKNPHPEAGLPAAILRVGAVWVCIPCLSRANHQKAQLIHELDARVRMLEMGLQVYGVHGVGCARAATLAMGSPFPTACSCGRDAILTGSVDIQPPKEAAPGPSDGSRASCRDCGGTGKRQFWNDVIPCHCIQEARP